jgi:hypothetical protein
MLRLLAQREQGYEEMAALMGLSVDEVRAKVRAALDALDASEPEAQRPPPPPVAPPLRPPSRPRAAAPAKPRTRRPMPKPRISLPADRGARIGLAAGASVAVVVVVLLLSGVLGGGESKQGSGGGGTDQSTSALEANSNRLTQAILAPADGGSASGRALFGRAGKRVVLQVQAQGLGPSPQGESYVVWLARSPAQMLPLAASGVDRSGKIEARYEVPTEVLAFLAGGSFDEIAVTLVSDSAFKRSVAQARSTKKAPAYTGVAVLRGKITGPIVDLATRNKR